MKKMKFMLFAIAAMATVSCTKEIVSPEDQIQTAVNYVDLEFNAEIEEITKTQLVNGTQVEWVVNDKVSVFDNSSSPQNTQFIALENGTSTTFSGSAPEATAYYALYPYRQVATIDGSTIKNAYLNPIQSAKNGSFNKDTAPMMGKLEGNNMLFKNIASHIKFTLDETCTNVKSITLMGNDNEPITGVYSVKWNNGNPVITPDATNCATYATVRVSGTLTPGDYYFTIFPTEFKNGFTVILSMNDGTQIARKTTGALSSVSSRNQIQPLKKMVRTDFADHMNYFVKYNDGFDLEFSGFKFNNQTEGFQSAKLYSNTLPMEIRKDGIYFVMPGTSVDKFKMNGWITYSKLTIIGADASVRSDIGFPAISANLADGGNHVLWANLKFNLTSTSTAPIIRGNFAKFGDVVINNCGFPGIPKNFMNADHAGSGATHAKMEFNSFIIEDSELGFASTGQTYLVMERASVGSSIGTVVINNNVFYNDTTATTPIDFILFHANNSGQGLDFEDFTMNNNTFVFKNLNAAVNTLHGVTKFTCNCNIFISDFTANSNIVNIYSPTAAVNPGEYPTAGKVTNNYYYDLDGNTDFGIYANKDILVNITQKAHPVELSKSPLSSLWNPSEYKFGAYSFTTTDPSKAPAANAVLGAQRADMTPESANADSADVGYSENKQGTI